VTPADKRPAHRPSRRKEIIEAATKAFSRDGYVEVRVDDIARAAGVAPVERLTGWPGGPQAWAEAYGASAGSIKRWQDRMHD
jgi:tetracycline repressor-like protein